MKGLWFEGMIFARFPADYVLQGTEARIPL
jgi:hypothetical protein